MPRSEAAKNKGLPLLKPGAARDPWTLHRVASNDKLTTGSALREFVR
jgi:hypothetical protein